MKIQCLKECSPKQALAIAAGAFLVIAGAFLIYLSIVINLRVDVIINNTMIALLQGARIDDFMPSIRAIIANGKLLNVPVWILMITAVFGVVMIYFGAIIIQFSIFNKKVKSILTKPFWFNWHPYNPD